MSIISIHSTESIGPTVADMSNKTSFLAVCASDYTLISRNATCVFTPPPSTGMSTQFIVGIVLAILVATCFLFFTRLLVVHRHRARELVVSMLRWEGLLVVELTLEAWDLAGTHALAHGCHSLFCVNTRHGPQMPRIEGCVGDCLVTLSLRDVPEAADIFIAFGTPLAVSARSSYCVPSVCHILVRQCSSS